MEKQVKKMIQKQMSKKIESAIEQLREEWEEESEKQKNRIEVLQEQIMKALSSKFEEEISRINIKSQIQSSQQKTAIKNLQDTSNRQFKQIRNLISMKSQNSQQAVRIRYQKRWLRQQKKLRQLKKKVNQICFKLDVEPINKKQKQFSIFNICLQPEVSQSESNGNGENRQKFIKENNEWQFIKANKQYLECKIDIQKSQKMTMAIGVVDKNYLNRGSNFIRQNSILYFVKNNILQVRGNKKQNTNRQIFYGNQIVLRMSERMIKWEADDQILAICYDKILSNQAIEWVPIVYWKDKGDILAWTLS